MTCLAHACIPNQNACGSELMRFVTQEEQALCERLEELKRRERYLTSNNIRHREDMMGVDCIGMSSHTY